MTEGRRTLNEVDNPYVEGIAAATRNAVRGMVLDATEHAVLGAPDEPAGDLAGGVVTGALVGVIEAYWLFKPEELSLEEARASMHELVDHYLDMIARSHEPRG